MALHPERQLSQHSVLRPVTHAWLLGEHFIFPQKRRKEELRTEDLGAPQLQRGRPSRQTVLSHTHQLLTRMHVHTSHRLLTCTHSHMWLTHNTNCSHEHMHTHDCLYVHNRFTIHMYTHSLFMHTQAHTTRLFTNTGRLTHSYTLTQSACAHSVICIITHVVHICTSAHRHT